MGPIPGSCENMWPKLSQSKHSMPQPARFVQGGVCSDPVRENIRTLVQTLGWRCFLPLDDMKCQVELCGYSSHFSSEDGEGRKWRQPKDPRKGAGTGWISAPVDSTVIWFNNTWFNLSTIDLGLDTSSLWRNMLCIVGCLATPLVASP